MQMLLWFQAGAIGSWDSLLAPSLSVRLDGAATSATLLVLPPVVNSQVAKLADMLIRLSVREPGGLVCAGA